MGQGFCVSGLIQSKNDSISSPRTSWGEEMRFWRRMGNREWEMGNEWRPRDCYNDRLSPVGTPFMASANPAHLRRDAIIGVREYRHLQGRHNLYGSTWFTSCATTWFTQPRQAFMPRKALDDGLGRHSLCGASQPAERGGGLLAKNACPGAPSSRAPWNKCRWTSAKSKK